MELLYKIETLKNILLPLPTFIYVSKIKERLDLHHIISQYKIKIHLSSPCDNICPKELFQRKKKKK